MRLLYGSKGFRMRHWPIHKFDEQTGQVYTESTSAIQHYDDHNWNYCLYPITETIFEDRDTRSWEKGARSLRASAIEFTVQNISDITQEAFECLPVHLVGQIWDAVHKRNAISFEIWRIFSKVLRHKKPELNLLDYNQTITCPKSPLRIYTAPLTSKSLDFLTSLSITVAFPIPDLLRLSEIPNLSMLEIVNLTNPMDISAERSVFGVGDRLIRAWHLAASNDGAFPVLRILRLWNYENLTNKSLAFLNSFPALAIYDVAGCGFEQYANSHPRDLGWTPFAETNLPGILEDACMERILLMQDRLSGGDESAQATAWQLSDDPTSIWSIPRVDVPDFLVQTKLSSLSELSKQSRRWTFSGQTYQAPFPRSVRVDTWGDMLYKIFPRVGELWNDADFARAEVDIGDQVIVGNALRNSVPMASLRLGGEYPATLNIRPLSFIRIKLPATTSAPNKGDDSGAARSGRTRELTTGTSIKKEDSGAVMDVRTGESRHLHDAHQKRPRHTVVKSKKRKLDDLLDSFL